MTNGEIRTVNRIKGAYEAHEETKLERLKRLNKSVKRPVEIFAYIFGIIGALILGTGMCLAMEVIGGSLMIPGVAIGIVGLLMAGLNYPLYCKMLKSRRAKYAEEIVALSNELLND